MPTYEYTCTECGQHVEAVQAFTADPLTECPHCGGRLRKVFAAPGIVLKGSGFYKTDSRAAGTPGAKSGAGSSDGAGSSESAGSGGGDKDGGTKSGGATEGSTSGTADKAKGNGSGSDSAPSTKKEPAGTG